MKGDDPTEIYVPPLETPRTIDRREAVTRERLAYIVVGLVAGLTVCSMICVGIFPHEADNIKQIDTGAIHDLMIILGGVIGYYFGMKR
jgi:hypothetical protein